MLLNLQVKKWIVNFFVEKLKGVLHQVSASE
jgi:hypothetical protein